MRCHITLCVACKSTWMQLAGPILHWAGVLALHLIGQLPQALPLLLLQIVRAVPFVQVTALTHQLALDSVRPRQALLGLLQALAGHLGAGRQHGGAVPLRSLHGCRVLAPRMHGQGLAVVGLLLAHVRGLQLAAVLRRHLAGAHALYLRGVGGPLTL